MVTIVLVTILYVVQLFLYQKQYCTVRCTVRTVPHLYPLPTHSNSLAILCISISILPISAVSAISLSLTELIFNQQKKKNNTG